MKSILETGVQKFIVDMFVYLQIAEYYFEEYYFYNNKDLTCIVKYFNNL